MACSRLSVGPDIRLMGREVKRRLPQDPSHFFLAARDNNFVALADKPPLTLPRESISGMDWDRGQ